MKVVKVKSAKRKGKNVKAHTRKVVKTRKKPVTVGKENVFDKAAAKMVADIQASAPKPTVELNEKQKKQAGLKLLNSTASMLKERRKAVTKKKTNG